MSGFRYQPGNKYQNSHLPLLRHQLNGGALTLVPPCNTFNEMPLPCLSDSCQSAAYRPPSVACRLSSVVSRLSFTAYRLSSAVCCLLSVVCCLSSVVYRLSPHLSSVPLASAVCRVCRLPSVVHHPLSAVCRTSMPSAVRVCRLPYE